jgi:hypothetical protein
VVWDIGALIEMSDVRGDSVLWMDKEVGEQEQFCSFENWPDFLNSRGITPN